MACDAAGRRTQRARGNKNSGASLVGWVSKPRKLAARQDRLPFDRTGGGNQPLPLKEDDPGPSIGNHNRDISGSCLIRQQSHQCRGRASNSATIAAVAGSDRRGMGRWAWAMSKTSQGRIWIEVSKVTRMCNCARASSFNLACTPATSHATQPPTLSSPCYR